MVSFIIGKKNRSMILLINLHIIINRNIKRYVRSGQKNTSD
jgi:hypothetical protein